MKALFPDFLSLRRFKKATAYIRNYGVIALAKILRNKLVDLTFDPLNSVKTSRIEDPKRLHSDDVLKYASLAGPTMARPFLKFLQKNDFPRDGYFVDYGSGKGRALILAARTGFKKLKGIEIVEAWVKISERNLLSVKAVIDDCKLYCMNVTEYDPKPEDQTFYFYDPFTDEVLLVCLDKICKSLAENPRKITIVIHHNYRQDWSQVMKTCGDDLKFSQQKVLGESYFIWQS